MNNIHVDKNINTNKIFEQFGSSKDNPEILSDLDNNPLYWVNKFKKLISNHLTSKDEIVKNFIKNDIDNKLSEEDVGKAGDFLIYNRAYQFILKINMDMLSHSDAVYSIADLKLIKILNLTIHYFELVEEYEKCLFLKNIEDKVKIYLKKFGDIKKEI